MIITERILLPDKCRTLLWDMDGVLLDTLGLDFAICDEIINKYSEKKIEIPKEFIRSVFAYHPPEFWKRIIEFAERKYQIFGLDVFFEEMLQEYNEIRNNSVFAVNPGIIEILEECRKSNIKQAVVSNTPLQDIEKILSLSGIRGFFDIVIGNDTENLRKKPFPDTYIYAADKLNIKLENCVVIEDSILGSKAGYSVGAFTIGVATGSADFSELEKSGFTHAVYSSFKKNSLTLIAGEVRNKKIETANDFVSHAIEHIAWRMGYGINLFWNNNNLAELGKYIGKYIFLLEKKKESAAALGMIDDGSAEIVVKISDKPKVTVESVKNIDIDWFMNLRCEQVSSGYQLLELIEGLSQSLKAEIFVRICSAEDPHHTWEGVFRGIGIALNKMFNLPQDVEFADSYLNKAAFSRKTAETSINVCVDFKKENMSKFNFKTASSVNVSGFKTLLKEFAHQAGFSLEVDFEAQALSSSHVVLEDTGIVIGKVLKKILIERMNCCGINGAGSSINEESDFAREPVRVSVSVEGRKFWRIVPFVVSYDTLKKDFIIGKNVCVSLFSEDLDDFLDGLAGGLGASIIVHIKKMLDPDTGWKSVFLNLGKAFKEVFEPNIYRKGVPPGVKASLD